MNDFDKILKQKLEGYTEVPPESVFENVCKNIPKRTFSDVLSAHKYLFISAVAAVAVVTAVLVVYLPEDETSTPISNTIIENLTPDAPETNQPTDLLVAANGETSTPEPSNPKLTELISQPENKVDALNLNDTIICGSELTIEGIDASKVKASNGLNLTKVASGVKISSTAYGTHTLDLQNGNSVKITFVEPEKLAVKASKTDLCYGERLTVDVVANSPVSWNDEGYSVKKLNAGKYELSGLNSGRNCILLTADGRCASKVAFDVNVAEKLSHSVSTKANYCSGNNGQIEIKSQSAISYCRINGKEISRSGIFTGLNAGTYTVEINYTNSCIAYDTIVVNNKSKLNATFESTKDAFNDKAYTFRNYTRLDDYGNVQNVDFEWLVNGKVVSTDYNFDYEFESNGKYTVELVARTGDCESRYSKTIDVVSSDFRIPNVFTPNGDGIGDEFTLYYDGTLLDYDLSIYTKAGQLVFHSQQLDNYWDGKISGNNEASEGVYFYVITATNDKNEKLTHKGTVQLIRR